LQPRPSDHFKSRPTRKLCRAGVEPVWTSSGLGNFFLLRLLYVLTPRSTRALQRTGVLKCLGDHARRKPPPVAGSRRTLRLGGGSVGGYKTTRRPPFPDVPLGPLEPLGPLSRPHLTTRRPHTSSRRLGDQATRDERFRSEVVPLGRPASEKQRVGSEQGEEQ